MAERNLPPDVVKNFCPGGLDQTPNVHIEIIDNPCNSGYIQRHP